MVQSILQRAKQLKIMKCTLIFIGEKNFIKAFHTLIECVQCSVLVTMIQLGTHLFVSKSQEQ